MAGPEQKRIEFAPQDRLAPVEHLIPRFFAEVIQRDYRDFLITDLSDLCDMFDEAEVQSALDRMDEHICSIPGPVITTIVDLLELLHHRGVSS